jgi:hypothetical protein
MERAREFTPEYQLGVTMCDKPPAPGRLSLTNCCETLSQFVCEQPHGEIANGAGTLGQKDSQRLVGKAWFGTGWGLSDNKKNKRGTGVRN